ncbi:MAG: LamG domain-containing protein [Chitinophagaceae bacterium]|nr:LamG domain-containing protein [Chitinophagaceae bacterium]
MKTKLVTTILVCTLSVFFSCKKDKTDPPLNNNSELLGPETSKVTHFSFNGSLNDGSGNGLHAADSFNITYTADRFGRANQAAVFGGASNPSWILTPSLGAVITGFPMAISFWFKPVNVSAGQTIIKADGFERSASSGFIVAFGYRPGQIGFTIGDKTVGGSTGTNYVVTPQNVLTNNTWQHVVVNVRGANDYDFYINGTKINGCTVGGSATSMVFYPAPVRGIIGNNDDYPAYYEGALDDYRIYTKVLSQQEVNTLYTYHP